MQLFSSNTTNISNDIEETLILICLRLRKGPRIYKRDFFKQYVNNVFCFFFAFLCYSHTYLTDNCYHYATLLNKTLFGYIVNLFGNFND